ncbi:hypothetical protein L218DRAFT_1008587, partial [Marasmius fiardii PR-910]
NKKPKLDISPTNTLFGSESGESEASVEEDIEDVEAARDELDDISHISVFFSALSHFDPFFTGI